MKHLAGHFRLSKRSRYIVAILSAFVVAYALSGLGIFFFIKYQRGITGVSCWDVLLPTRWSHYRVARGEHYIKEAQHFISQNAYLEALPLLRVGLNSAPRHLQGRLILSQLYTDFDRPDLAEACLQDGLTIHRDDPLYLGPYLNFLLKRQQDSRVLAICRELLPLLPSTTPRDRLLAFTAATACYNSGNYDQAEDYLRAAELQQQRDGRLLSLRISWDSLGIEATAN